MQFILYLLLILLFTKVVGHVSVKLGQPAVLGKLIAGIVPGPAVLGWVRNDSLIHNMSEIGVLLAVVMSIFGMGGETSLGLLVGKKLAFFVVAILGRTRGAADGLR